MGGGGKRREAEEWNALIFNDAGKEKRLIVVTAAVRIFFCLQHIVPDGADQQ